MRRFYTGESAFVDEGEEPSIRGPQARHVVTHLVSPMVSGLAVLTQFCGSPPSRPRSVSEQLTEWGQVRGRTTCMRPRAPGHTLHHGRVAINVCGDHNVRPGFYFSHGLPGGQGCGTGGKVALDLQVFFFEIHQLTFSCFVSVFMQEKMRPIQEIRALLVLMAPSP